MSAHLLLPLYFLHFWFVKAPLGLLRYFYQLNEAYFEVFSVFLLLKTFFKPLKNEYRKGLVGFSRGMGMAVKSAIILFALILFLPLLLLEAILFLGFIIFPLVTVSLLFVTI